MSYVLIIGAKSDIAKATAKEYASNGYNLYLAARNARELESFASDIAIRFDVNTECLELDILDYSSHRAFYDKLAEKPSGIISAVGYLGNQELAQNNFQEAEKIINTNYTGIVSLLNIISADFAKRGAGFIIGISSVAGDRGRKANYMYGSAKAAFTAYLSGLRNRLYVYKVHVLTVKPGFVFTSMTAGMKLPARLTACPGEVANAIFKAHKKGKNIVYTKWIWRYIMSAIRNIPEWQFKRMSI